jgi:hypothetical protein
MAGWFQRLFGLRGDTRGVTALQALTLLMARPGA